MSDFINIINIHTEYCCNCNIKFISEKDKFYIAKDQDYNFAWCKKCFKLYLIKLDGFIKL